MSQYEIGSIVGKNNALLVLGRVRQGERLLYKVQCQICKNDKELYGDAVYDVAGCYFTIGKLPCGCAHIPKRTYDQWLVIIKRKATLNNHTFHGFIKSDKFDQNTKCKLSCNVCCHHWETCSISNYVRDRGCPKCATLSKAKKRSTSTEDWVDRFRKTGMFPKEQYSFERQTETGRLWNVFCTKCEGSVFVSDRSNLVAGKVPCNCGTGGGIDVNKSCYFYLLTVSICDQSFLKFGITNFPKRRMITHTRALQLFDGKITSSRIFKGNGSMLLSIESELKRKLAIERKEIDGFKKESCSIDNADYILSLMASFEEVTGTMLV